MGWKMEATPKPTPISRLARAPCMCNNVFLRKAQHPSHFLCALSLGPNRRHRSSVESPIPRHTPPSRANDTTRQRSLRGHHLLLQCDPATLVKTHKRHVKSRINYDPWEPSYLRGMHSRNEEYEQHERRRTREQGTAQDEGPHCSRGSPILSIQYYCPVQSRYAFLDFLCCDSFSHHHVRNVMWYA